MSDQSRAALVVLGDAAFAAQKRVQKGVDVRDCAVVEANGSVDEDMTGTGGQSDGLRITTGAYVHLPMDAQSDMIGARIEQGKTARCNPHLKIVRAPQ